MGFQASDLEEMARSLLDMPGVSEVWKLASMEARSATLWILVSGFDEEAFQNRLQVRRAMERFLTTRQMEMEDSEFIFDYYLVVDEEGIGSPQIPEGAERIAA